MSNLTAIREEVRDLLNAAEEIPAGMVALALKPKDILSEIETALAKLNAAIFVLPPEPLEAEDVGGAVIVFFPRVEVRVRVVQNVVLSDIALEATEARDLVMRLLQGAQLSAADEPLQLAPRPVSKAEFPGQIIYDVIFHTAAHL